MIFLRKLNPSVFLLNYFLALVLERHSALRTLAAFVEDLGLVPSAHIRQLTAAHNFSSGGSDSLWRPEEGAGPPGPRKELSQHPCPQLSCPFVLNFPHEALFQFLGI